MRNAMKTWQGRTCVRVNSERLFTLDVGRLAPRLRIPSFQRGYVWSAEDAVALLDSIVLGYPIGSVVLWDPTAGDWGLSSDRLIVLDGQQRLTTLAGAVLSGGFGNAVRVAYDVAADAFAAVAGDLTPDQIAVGDMGTHRMGRFWREQADRHPETWRPIVSASEAAAREARLWAEIAPGVPFPRTKAARKTRAALLGRLDDAVRADEEARRAAWTAWTEANPDHDLWLRRLEFVERRMREHQTSVTVVRGGTLADVREIFRRLNTAGRPLDEAGVAALLESDLAASVQAADAP